MFHVEHYAYLSVFPLSFTSAIPRISSFSRFDPKNNRQFAAQIRSLTSHTQRLSTVSRPCAKHVPDHLLSSRKPRLPFVTGRRLQTSAPVIPTFFPGNHAHFSAPTTPSPVEFSIFFCHFKS
jgi:hypothetical protein